MSFLRRTRGSISLALAVVCVAVTAEPAQASRESQRPRAGASTWVPRRVTVTSYKDTSTRAVLRFDFRWDGSTQRSQMEGDYHTFEIGADIPCSWMKEGSFDETYQGYDPAYWLTNIPASALPYEDTIFGDSCPFLTQEGEVRWGFGVLKAEDLTNGVDYYVELGLIANSGSGWVDGPIKVSVQTGTKLDVNSPSSYDDADCSWSSSEKNAWNNPTVAALDKRLEASWCGWPDWTHVVAHDEFDYVETGETVTITTNKLTNYSLESSGSPSAGWSYEPTLAGGGATRICNDGAYPSFQGSCYVQFNNGLLVQTVIADPRSVTGGHVTAEAAFRCRTPGVATCNILPRVWGLGQPYPNGANQMTTHFFQVPNDGHWYVCRTDYDHWTPSDGGTTWQEVNDSRLDAPSPHGWRLQFAPLYPYPTVDVDFAFLGGKTFYYDAEYGFPVGDPDGDINAGDRPTCTQMV